MTIDNMAFFAAIAMMLDSFWSNMYLKTGLHEHKRDESASMMDKFFLCFILGLMVDFIIFFGKAVPYDDVFGAMWGFMLCAHFYCLWFYNNEFIKIEKIFTDDLTKPKTESY